METPNQTARAEPQALNGEQGNQEEPTEQFVDDELNKREQDSRTAPRTETDINDNAAKQDQPPSHEVTTETKTAITEEEDTIAEEQRERNEECVSKGDGLERATSPPTGVDATATKPAEEWIDRTNAPLEAIGNGYELTPTLTSLCLTNNRIKEIRSLEPCLALRELGLRQNAITTVEGLDTLENLVDLDLYMNRITEIPPSTFQANPRLRRLDLSFNELRTLDSFPSGNLPNLEELYLIGNKIKFITGLRDMPKLTMLELGDNRIRDIENLEHLASLHGLWLGRNKITRIENLEPLLQLRRLSLQSNRIEVIEGLSHLVLLEELYLSHNGIESMQGVETLTNLRVLDLGVNFIEHIECVQDLCHLKEFWINGNKLQSFEELEQLSSATELETVYLEGNPLASDEMYQQKALKVLPNSLKQLDALLADDVRKEIAVQESAPVEPVVEEPDEAAEATMSG